MAANAAPAKVRGAADAGESLDEAFFARSVHDVARDLLQALGDTVTVNGTRGDDLKDQQVERARQQLVLRMAFDIGIGIRPGDAAQKCDVRL